MPRKKTKQILRLPLIPLRGLMVFPHMVLHFDVGRPRSISALDNFISINNAVDIDLFGQVSSESSGIKHISGVGGQLDFVLGAYLSNGGKSFICCSSTFKTKDGELKSRGRLSL